tara:strand:- start:178 stop:306 length:129 start_codon:yes stop_codon:yes gene_type:complete
MSTLNHESILETLFEEVLEEYPQFDEEQCETIAKQRFEDMLQ